MWKILALTLFTLACTWLLYKSCQPDRPPRQLTRATDIKRPAKLPASAFLVNLRYDGEMDDSVFTWINYVGAFRYQGKKYAHIHGFAIYDDDGNATDTTYYENMNERRGKKPFDFKEFSLIYYYSSEIKLASKEDTTILFYVLPKSTELHNGLTYIGIPTVRQDSALANAFVSDILFSIYIKKISQNQFAVSLLNRFDHITLSYQLSKACRKVPPLTSFMNKTHGTIYFVDKECYLELENKSDTTKLKSFYTTSHW